MIEHDIDIVSLEMFEADDFNDEIAAKLHAHLLELNGDVLVATWCKFMGLIGTYETSKDIREKYLNHLIKLVNLKPAITSRVVDHLNDHKEKYDSSCTSCNCKEDDMHEQCWQEYIS